jgi:hypothetical protein
MTQKILIKWKNRGNYEQLSQHKIRKILIDCIYFNNGTIINILIMIYSLIYMHEYHSEA